MIFSKDTVVIGGNQIWTPTVTVIDSVKKSFDSIMKRIFANGEQGAYYDPNDLTDEKINWRKNMVQSSTMPELYMRNYTVAAAPDASHKLTATVASGGGYPLGRFDSYPIGTTSPNNSTIYRSVEVKEDTAHIIRFGAAADNSAVILNLKTQVVLRNVANLPLTMTKLADGFTRIELFDYRQTFSTVGLSNLLGWGVSQATALIEESTQVGTSIFMRKPSFVVLSGENYTAPAFQEIITADVSFMKAFPNHTLFQDIAGTIPVTAQMQPVGLMLDKSKGVVGTELNNNNFDVNLDGWGVGNNAQATIVNKEANVTLHGSLTATSNNWFYLRGNYIQNTYYVVEFDATYVSGGNLQCGVGYNAALTVQSSANGGYKTRYRCIVTGTNNTSLGLLTFGASTANSVWKIDNVSFKPIFGNHAYQSVSTSRALLKQSPILGNELVVNSEFNTDVSGWTSVLVDTEIVFNKVKITVKNTGGRLVQGIPTVVGKVYQISWKSEAIVGMPAVRLGNSSGAFDVFNDTNAVGNKSRIFTATSTTTFVSLTAASTNDSAYFDSITVKEITGYYTDRNYIETDGIDDFLQTNSIDFTATDKVSVLTGVRKLSDASVQMIAELSSGNQNTNMFSLLRGAGSTEYVQSFLRASASGAYCTVNNAAYAAPTSLVVAAKYDISGSSKQVMQINSKVAATSLINVGVGNFGNYPLYIGRRGGTSLPFSGHIYGLIVLGRLATDTETAAIEKEFAKRMGVTLSV